MDGKRSNIKVYTLYTQESKSSCYADRIKRGEGGIVFVLINCSLCFVRYYTVGMNSDEGTF